MSSPHPPFSPLFQGEGRINEKYMNIMILIYNTVQWQPTGPILTDYYLNIFDIFSGTFYDPNFGDEKRGSLLIDA